MVPLPAHPNQPLALELGLEHLPACLALDQRALGGLWTAAQWSSELQEPRRPCWGLLEGEQLIAVACGWLVVDELHITVVAVDPARQRQGLGRRVLERLLEQAAALAVSYTHLTLPTTSRV